MTKKVTVIIVNWNGEKFLEQCLAALMQQTVMPHKIIVVDNASSDSSCEIVHQFPLVQLLKLDQNTGFARGNNLAIEIAVKDSEWIALLNPDAFAEPNWLEELLAATECHPTFDVFGSKLIKAEYPTTLDGIGDAYHISGRVWRIGHNAHIAEYPQDKYEIFSPCAAAALYRRDALLTCNGFDEDYFCYVEDVDLGFRLRLNGYRSLFVPQSVVYHIGSGTTGGGRSDFATYHGHRNLVWTYIKNMPSILFWLLLPLHLLMNISTVLWLTLNGQGKVILRAKRDALLGIPKMWRKRQQIQRAKIASTKYIWQLLNKSWNMDCRRLPTCPKSPTKQPAPIK